MAFLGLVACAFAALAMSYSGAGAQPVPEPLQPIRVVSSTHEIGFPTEVLFRLEAEASTEIVEVTLFYRLGRQKTTIYGYPTFARGNRVSADYRLKTAGPAYIPSGAEIEYYYVVRDADGNSVKTETLSLEYKDPSYDWQRLRMGDVLFLWHNRSRESVERAAEEVSSRLVSVKELLGLDEIGPMKAVILNNSREAAKAFPVVSQTARRFHLFGGFAFGQHDLFVLVGLNPAGIVHEMTHLLVDEAVGSPLGRVPAWLNEGLATYFESRSSRREAAVARATRDDSLFPLRSMDSIPGQPRDVGLFYAQSWSIVNHMMTRRGEDRMSALFALLSEGNSLDGAVEGAYGMTLDELEAEWKATLSPSPAVSSRPNVGTVGTSALIGGAIAVAAVAVLVRWIRRATTGTGGEGPDS